MVFEMLQSKIAVTVVALVLIGTVVGLEEWFRSDFEARMLDRYATRFQEAVNGVITASGDLVHTQAVFDTDGEGVSLPPTVGKEHYRVVIGTNMVFFQCGDHRVGKQFFTTVHTWNYYAVFGSKPFSQDVMKDMDSRYYRITIDSGKAKGIGITKIRLSDGVEERCEVFVYPLD